ncbi:DNA polymerase delta catalytic subunit [Klebsormidium nitens]|uniref:DNA polymerase n=1 Tax=Klebsormidium nitens TaxID=105231 RepID=A0A1Y1HP29_KLENI|nr:DNA polymerase delta catalytic subunit [Klebsormidium nitens]|eukprot:GAQ79793.1 DNA polymerase delta catalytic subunit [Klebsormidium nitens]
MQTSGKRPGMQSVGAPPPSKRLNGGPTHDTPGDSPDPFEDPDFMEEEEEFYVEEEAPPAAAEIRLGGDDERMRQWKRPPVEPPINQATDDIVFQQLDIDYVVGTTNRDLLPYRRSDKAAIIRMFGVNSQGNSVCVFVHGFEPYFYIPLPPGYNPDSRDIYLRDLDTALANADRQGGRPGSNVLDIEVERKQSVLYYQRKRNRPFLKITLALPTMVATLRGLIERGLMANGVYLPTDTYESNVLFALRFMIDRSIVGCNWIELPAGAYRLNRGRARSFCQIEVDVMFDKLISHPASGSGLYSTLAPFRILSFDIECQGRKGHFPDAKEDPVIQIANLVTLQGSSKPLIRNVMTLNSCSPIVGADVFSHDTEAELLLRWAKLVRDVDPDVIIGYNIANFDLPYLIERARVKGLQEFQFLGRVQNTRIKMRDTTFSSKAYGTRESKEITIEGRLQFDVLQAMQRDYKLSSYSLNSVSAIFLGEQKEDVHHSIISDLQNGNPDTRRRLAVYCLKDAYLPQRLLDKLMFVYNYVEMARVTGVPFGFLLARGQSIKVLSQIMRKARTRDLLVPNLKVQGQPGDGIAYEGATVLEAKQGFYEKPIATLDFASLYPSIMMAHNLCYTTLIPKNQVAEVASDIGPENVTKTPTGDTFVKADMEKGILPEILEELLAARKRAKADLKLAKDPLEKAVLDGRQLALKVSANSVYGFTGATVGKLPCLEISSSTTAYGRQMIEHTKMHVQSKFNIANGYKFDAEVIYGDTDSVMIRFGPDDVSMAMELGREAAGYVSATFIKPIKLEFEKVYCPYLLISKKRYAGLLWTTPDKYDKMDTKGIETVRRDNCLLVKNLVTESLHKILIDRDVPGAVQYVKNQISNLLTNKVDLSLLVITKGLTKTAEKYENKSAHSELAERMRKRDPATAPNVGDRVPYVIIKGAKGARGFEKSEDPIYVLENNIPIDAQHYLENQLSKPLLRIFEPIMKNAARELLHGDHTRAVSILTPTVGGIMKFAKKRLSCLGCKAPIEKGTVCEHCGKRETELYQKSVHNVREMEDLFGRLWTQCQRCQGSLHQDVLCTSRDCPIFYRRKKVQKDLAEATTQLSRFEF